MKFIGAKLRGTFFIDCELTLADFNGADLSMANFEGANLCGADLSESNLYEAAFSRAVTDPVTMRNKDGRETGKSQKVNFSYADLRKTNLADSNLRNCETRGAVFG
jgi:uncharacterized protein YjbI with pentapeptide repeats